MRLSCSKCGAQYDVPDEIIPAGGRDVECSNCGHTWFEMPGAEPVAVGESEAPMPPEVVPEVAPEPSPEPESVAPPRPLPRRKLDPEIADILREEAEREAKRRESEVKPQLESQPDLGLEEPSAAPAPAAATAARARMAQLTAQRPAARTEAEDDVTEDTEKFAEPPRRERLPDIEEINSSLRPASESNDPGVVSNVREEPQRRGFRSGFVTVVTLAALATIIYIAAPQLAARIPALAGPLMAYEAAVNDLRLWIDLKVQGLL